MDKEEVINDGHLFTIRLVVEGGWIYSMYDKSHGIMSSVFVPTPHPGEDETNE